MKTPKSRSWTNLSHKAVASGCVMILLLGNGRITAQDVIPPAPAKPAAPVATPAPAATTAAAPADEPKLTSDQLDALVSPIALYPDSLLAQALVASTYPLEIVQLQQWLVKNKSLTGTALTDAAAKQPWDPSIQSMAAIPDLVKRLADDIQWTTELGNAFLAQQSDVMDSVQRMRKKATDKGTLKSGEQQVVETKVVEEKTVIVIEQANPEVIYVPSYNPTVVYGPPPVYYSYPPVYYPPYTPGAAFFSFSVGVAVGAAFWGGGCGWGHNDIHVDIDRNVNRNTNINRNNTTNRNGSGNRSTWSHDSKHRGAAPYSSKSTANKFSGSAASSRAQAGAGGNRVSSAQQSLGASSRSAGTSSFSGSGAGASRTSAGVNSASRSSGAGGANRSASSASAGGNRMAGRDMPSASASRSSGFSGGSSGFSASGARASSSRGASSMGGSRGGGGGRRR